MSKIILKTGGWRTSRGYTGIKKFNKQLFCVQFKNAEFIREVINLKGKLLLNIQGVRLKSNV